MPNEATSGRRIECAFCGRSKDQVRRLVAGPSSYICDDCIAMCNEILTEEEQDALTGASESE